MFKRSVLLLDPFDAAVDALALPARLSGCMIGGSSSKSSSQSQQTSSPVINQPGLTMLNANGQRAQDVVANTFQPFTGQMAAPLSVNQQAAMNAAPGMLNAGAPALNAATNASYGLTGYRPPQATPGLVGSAPQASWNNAGLIDPNSIPSLSAGIQKYMNPYTSDVINTTMSDLERQREQARVADNQNATASGAFGGNRQGVSDALTNEAYDRTAASTLANLRSSGFNTAAGLAGQDVGNALQLGTANANLGLANAQGAAGTSQYNAGLIGDLSKFNAGNTQQTNLANASNSIAGAGVRQNAANSLQNASAEQQQQFGNYITSLMNTGAVDQQTVQNNLDRLYAEFQRQQQYPFQGQQLINQSEGLIPYSLGQSSQGTSSGTGKSSAFNFSLPMPPAG